MLISHQMISTVKFATFCRGIFEIHLSEKILCYVIPNNGERFESLGLQARTENSEANKGSFLENCKADCF